MCWEFGHGSVVNLFYRAGASARYVHWPVKASANASRKMQDL